MAVSNSYRDSLRLMSVQFLIPAPVRMAELVSGLLRAEVGCHAAGAVAGNLCFRAIGIEQLRACTSASGAGNSHSTPSAPTP